MCPSCSSQSNTACPWTSLSLLQTHANYSLLGAFHVVKHIVITEQRGQQVYVLMPYPTMTTPWSMASGWQKNFQGCDTPPRYSCNVWQHTHTQLNSLTITKEKQNARQLKQNAIVNKPALQRHWYRWRWVHSCIARPSCLQYTINNCVVYNTTHNVQCQQWGLKEVLR